jgi:VanZ family protein
VIVWLGVIALESTDMANAANTGRLLRFLLSFLPGDMARSIYEVTHFLFRKGGHFVGYGILALLFFRALRAASARCSLPLAAWAVVLTAAVASLDEFHQTFLPSRTGSVRDVALDTCGALCLLTIRLLHLWFTRNRPSPPCPSAAAD